MSSDGTLTSDCTTITVMKEPKLINNSNHHHSNKKNKWYFSGFPVSEAISSTFLISPSVIFLISLLKWTVNPRGERKMKIRSPVKSFLFSLVSSFFGHSYFIYHCDPKQVRGGPQWDQDVLVNLYCIFSVYVINYPLGCRWRQGPYLNYIMLIYIYSS